MGGRKLTEKGIEHSSPVSWANGQTTWFPHLWTTHHFQEPYLQDDRKPCFAVDVDIDAYPHKREYQRLGVEGVEMVSPEQVCFYSVGFWTQMCPVLPVGLL